MAGDGRRTAALLRLIGHDHECVAAYVSVGSEPDTAELLAALRRRGVRVLLPVRQPDDSLSFAVDAGRLSRGTGGIPEPAGPYVALAEATLVLVPALAVDLCGHRLGRGGGSYDRAVAGLASLRIALLHEGELLPHVPSEPHDVAVAAAALPAGIQRVGTAR